MLEIGRPYVESRALEIHEIREIIRDYQLAAEHAMAAGFDGVQLHAANGYLLDQFLRDGTNRRTDSYGGAVENRIRLLIEATETLIRVAGADRTGVRLSPNVPSPRSERQLRSLPRLSIL
jgi:N-ethylmaleimide reductase